MPKSAKVARQTTSVFVQKLRQQRCWKHFFFNRMCCIS